MSGCCEGTEECVQLCAMDDEELNAFAALQLLVQDRHPGVRDVARWFQFQHLPEDVQLVSRACCQLAYTMIATLPDSPQLTHGLHDLLRAKDAFVRAAL